MGNPRLRGKIAHSEWPTIAARVAGGESLAAIARSYSCTAPAIRYIARRTPDVSRDEKRVIDRDRSSREAPAATDVAVAALRDGVATRRVARGKTGLALDHALWSRVNSDIAAFLSAVDALMAEHTTKNEEALLLATDRLLRGAARTRLELEQAKDHHDRAGRPAGNDR